MVRLPRVTPNGPGQETGCATRYPWHSWSRCRYSRMPPYPIDIPVARHTGKRNVRVKIPYRPLPKRTGQTVVHIFGISCFADIINASLRKTPRRGREETRTTPISPLSMNYPTILTSRMHFIPGAIFPKAMRNLLAWPDW